MKRRCLILLLCLSLILPVFSASAEQETEPEETTQATEQAQLPATEATEAVAETTQPPATEATEPLTTQATEPPVTEATQPQPTDQQTTEPTVPNDQALQNLLAQLTDNVKTEEQRIRQQIMRIHSTTLERTGHSTLGGRCGLQVSWELYLLGINKYLITNDGRDHYDTYRDLEKTTGGYTPVAYDVKDYSLEQALNAITRNGTQDAYNIMVGFEKTNTEEGQKYGHVCFIHAILNGMVYCVEGFTSRFGTAEGEPIVITIAQFAQWFADWTEYEGLIYFGTGNLLDSFTHHASNMFVRCTVETDILSMPTLERSDLLRTAAMGERLQVTGMFESLDGTFYYRVADDGQVGYINAKDAEKFLMNPDDAQYADPVLPEALEIGEDFPIDGKITTEFSRLGKVWIKITNLNGDMVLEVELPRKGNACELGSKEVREALDTSGLPEGAYIFNVYANTGNSFLAEGKATSEGRTNCLASVGFTVGQAQLPEEVPTVPRYTLQKNGWNYVGGKWYYMEDKEPRIGWFCCDGRDYYMDETGAAVTGWVEINGMLRYFSHTGAMRTGWHRTPQGIGYMLRNGVTASGWRMVDGLKYCFDETGIMLSGGWTQMDGKLFYFYADGKTATGWVTLDGGNYSFHADGYLLAQRIETEEGTQIIPYDGTWEPVAPEENR